MNPRNISLDYAKGLLIVLVVFGHGLQYSFGSEYAASMQFFSNPLFQTIYSFHMPLFMLISGYLFSNSNKRMFRDLLITKLTRIGLPLIAFTVICVFGGLVQRIISGAFIDSITFLVSSIFNGWSMWYLSSLLLNIVIVALISRVVSRKAFQIVLLSILCIATLLIPDSIVLSAHKFMLPFFCIGFYMKEYGINIHGISKRRLGLLTLLSVISICWFDENTYIFTTGWCILGNPVQNLFYDFKRVIIAVLVSFTFLQYIGYLSQFTTVISSIFVKLGQISLFIYGVNMVVDVYYSILLSAFSINFRFNYFIPVIFAASIILICCAMSKVVAKNKVSKALLMGS